MSGRPLETPVFMLAADHRWQFEEWCDSRGVGRARIPEAKAAIVEGFLRARERSAAVRASGALLIDEQYASGQVAAARAAGVSVGTPAERSGVFPLQWADTPLDRALTGTFAKVLVRHRPEYDDDFVLPQRARLRELTAWCAAPALPLVLEVVVPRDGEQEDHFETIGRPPILAAYIRRAYAEGIVPAFWKVEGTTDAAAAAILDDAVAEREGPRWLVLGKGAGFDLVQRWFGVARGTRTAAGFAVGRTIYMAPVAAWLDGDLAREDAVEQVAGRYLRLVDAWMR